MIFGKTIFCPWETKWIDCIIKISKIFQNADTSIYVYMYNSSRKQLMISNTFPSLCYPPAVKKFHCLQCLMFKIQRVLRYIMAVSREVYIGQISSRGGFSTRPYGFISSLHHEMIYYHARKCFKTQTKIIDYILNIICRWDIWLTYITWYTE